MFEWFKNKIEEKAKQDVIDTIKNCKDDFNNQERFKNANSSYSNDFILPCEKEELTDKEALNLLIYYLLPTDRIANDKNGRARSNVHIVHDILYRWSRKYRIIFDEFNKVDRL